MRAVILTGMGTDGTDGARAVSAAGGLVVAQSEASCAVYGMSRLVLRAGFASREMDLASISAWMLEEVEMMNTDDRAELILAFIEEARDHVDDLND